jgi:fatty-acyl-CoA synthase
MITPNRFNKNTIGEMLCRRATFLPGSIAYSFPETGQVYTWKKTYTEVRVIAEGLIIRGIKKGDRIAVLMEDRMEVILTMFAAATIGAIAVPINSYSKKDELKSYFFDARPSVLIMGTTGHHLNYCAMVKAIMAEADPKDNYLMPANIFVVGDQEEANPFANFSDLLNHPTQMSDDDFVAACALTLAGTPKGVLRSAASFLVSKDKKAKSPGRLKARIMKKLDHLSNRFRLINLLPLYHLGGVSTLFTTLKASNFRVVILSHFNPVNAIDIIEKEKCQFLVGTPYMIQNMINILPEGSRKFDTIKGIAFASAAINGMMIDKISARFKKLYFFTVSYGSSEAGNVANGTCILNKANDAYIAFFLRFLTKMGLLNGVIKLKEFSKTPYSIGGRIDKNVEVKIRDVQSGEFVPVGSEGEIVIKSHRVMRYTTEAAVTESFLGDGWFRSGDMGYVGEKGLLIISGRIKRLISRGGEKVSPAEIENIILADKAILDAFVVGIPDELYGEQICAAVVARDITTVDIPQLKEQLQKRLSTFKLPKYFVVLPNFPLSSTGKIATDHIKELALQKINNGDYYS